eukprot:GHVR01116857.1.p1 GENE.GHVR01116857.1~~GHVR01116857.1.p1  ORF type:complete len:257 (-),score=17.22 GHVR01116857.1:232-1002(-)
MCLCAYYICNSLLTHHILFSGNTDMQILYCYVVLLGYTTAAGSKKPWRHFSSTLVEGFFMNALLLILNVWFLQRVVERLEKDNPEASMDYQKILLAVLVIPMVLSLLNVLTLVSKKVDFRGVFERRHMKHLAKLTEVLKTCALLFSKLDENEKRCLLNDNTSDDVQGLARAIRVFSLAIGGETPNPFGNRVRVDDAAEYNVEANPQEHAVDLENEAVTVSSSSEADWDEEVPKEEFIFCPKVLLFPLEGYFTHYKT